MPRERVRVFHPSGGPVLTKQSHALETDVNAILARYISHGSGTAHVNRQAPMYGDFSSGLDYASALNQIEGAKADFGRLPAHVRAHVRNDPGEFLNMMFDPERGEERERLGLVDHRGDEGDSSSAAGPGGDPAVVVEPVPAAPVVEGGE